MGVLVPVEPLAVVAFAFAFAFVFALALVGVDERTGVTQCVYRGGEQRDEWDSASA